MDIGSSVRSLPYASVSKESMRGATQATLRLFPRSAYLYPRIIWAAKLNSDGKEWRLALAR